MIGVQFSGGTGSWFHLLLFSCLELAAKGRNVSLQPSDVRVDIGSWASFNCTLPCDFSQTHTINWFIGDSPVSRRNVYLSINDVAEREFEEYTGIQIELQDASNCGSVTLPGQRMVQQRLRVFVSTARMINRTAVQCAALRKDPADVDMYSIFGVILVNGDPESEMTPPSCPETTPMDTTTSPPTIQPSSCQTVTVTQTVTVSNLLPSQLPAPAQGNGACTVNFRTPLFLTVLLAMSLSLLSLLD